MRCALAFFLALTLWAQNSYSDTLGTWNPSDKTSGITLSNANLTAIGSGGWNGVRSTLPRDTGKYYFEMVRVASGRHCGLAPAGGGWNGQGGVPGIPDSLRAWDSSGGWATVGAATPYGNDFASPGGTGGDGDVCMVAFDADNNKLWLGKNGVWFGGGNPATGTNSAWDGITGSWVPAATSYPAGSGWTANFGQSAFAHTVPAGFTAGWGDITPPEPEQVDLSAFFALIGFTQAAYVLLGSAAGLCFVLAFKKGGARS